MHQDHRIQRRHLRTLHIRPARQSGMLCCAYLGPYPLRLRPPWFHRRLGLQRRRAISFRPE